jgi:hypothetical protein
MGRADALGIFNIEQLKRLTAPVTFRAQQGPHRAVLDQE